MCCSAPLLHHPGQDRSTHSSGTDRWPPRRPLVLGRVDSPVGGLTIIVAPARDPCKFNQFTPTVPRWRRRIMAASAMSVQRLFDEVSAGMLREDPDVERAHMFNSDGLKTRRNGRFFATVSASGSW